MWVQGYKNQEDKQSTERSPRLKNTRKKVKVKQRSMNDNEDSEASISSSSLSVLNWLTSTLKQSFTILSIYFSLAHEKQPSSGLSLMSG